MAGGKRMEYLDKIKQLRESSKKRSFKQRFDLIINLKEFDVNKADNKFDEIVTLPNGLGKPVSITLFSSDDKKIDGCIIVKDAEIEKLEKDKKELSKLINSTQLFLSEPKLMPVVGKHLGKYLAPRGLMPKPLIGNVENAIKDYKKGVRLTIKKQPILHTVIGTEDMKDEELNENIKILIEFLKNKLPKGRNNLGKIVLKMTMSKPIKLE